MLLRFFRNEIAIQRCLYDWFKFPRLVIRNKDTDWNLLFSWLGGCIVWSRLKRTHKNTYGVQED